MIENRNEGANEMTEHNIPTIDDSADFARCSCGHLVQGRDAESVRAGLSSHQSVMAQRATEAAAPSPPRRTRGRWDPERHDAHSSRWAADGYGDGDIS